MQGVLVVALVVFGIVAVSLIGAVASTVRSGVRWAAVVTLMRTFFR